MKYSFSTSKKKLGPQAYGYLIIIFYTKITLQTEKGYNMDPYPPKIIFFLIFFSPRCLCHYTLVGCVLFSRWLTQSLIVILPRSGPLQHSWRASFSCYSYAPWQLLVWKWGNAWIPALLAQDSLRISAEVRGDPEMPNNCESRECSIQIRWRREDGCTERKGGKNWITDTHTQMHRCT